MQFWEELETERMGCANLSNGEGMFALNISSFILFDHKNFSFIRNEKE